MSNYTKTTNFGAKDTLPSGDSQKIIRGTEFDTEFNNVATAIATKLEVDGSNNLAISGTFSSTKLIPTGGTATGNGMYLPAANTLALSTNGTERVRVDSSGNLGVGRTPSGSAIVDVQNDANAIIRVRGGAGSNEGSAFYGVSGSDTTRFAFGQVSRILGGTPNDDAVVYAAGYLAFAAAGSERARIDSSGNLGVGTASPGAKLDIGGTNNTVFFKNSGATTGYALAAVSNTGGAFQYGISSSTGTFWGSGNAGNYSANIGTTTATNLGFGTNDTLRMLLDSSGNLGLGVTPSAWNSATKNIQNPAGSLFSINTTDSGVSQNLFLDSTGTWKYVNTAAASYFAQSSGSFVWTSVGSGTAGATASLTTKMTLDSSGNLGLGATPSAWGSSFRVLQHRVYGAEYDTQSGQFGLVSNAYNNGTNWIYNSNNPAFRYEQDLVSQSHRWFTAPSGTAGNTITFYSALTLSGSDTSSLLTMGRGFLTQGTGYAGAGSSTADPYVFYTDNTERARITSGGDLLVGTTAKRIDERVVFVFNGTAASGLNLDDSATTGTSNAQRFYRNAVQVGTITTTTTATAYNTSSDYRLKDNQQPLTGSGAFIDALQPKTWDWATDGSKGVGFIAHEVQTVSPNSVVGEKDAVDADGNPIMQAMEYGSAEFIANIVAELQSLRARVATLENN